MPLSKGKSRKSISENIAHEIRQYKKTGKIGTSKPRSMKAARRQAAAIAYATARKAKR